MSGPLATGAGGGGAAGAPVDAQYVVLVANATLTVERVLTAGTGITLTDGGAGAAVTVAVGTTVVRSDIENTFTADQNILPAGATNAGVHIQTAYDVSASSSGRLFFDEKEGASANKYGFSFIYAGDTNPTLGGTSFTLSGNTFYLMRHNGTVGGLPVLSFGRTSGIMTIFAPLTVPDSLTLSGTGGAFGAATEALWVGGSGNVGLQCRGDCSVYIDSNNNSANLCASIF